MRRVFVLLQIGLLISTFALSSCGSRFAETPVAPVPIEGDNLDQRMNEKERIDRRLESVQNTAKKAKNILEIFRKAQDPDGLQDTYTPIDFLLDVNLELRDKLPEKRTDKLIRYGKIVLPNTAVPEECRNVDLMLETSLVAAPALPEAPPVSAGERLTYSIKGCGTEEKFVEVAVAEWINEKFEFQIVNKNLQHIFREVLREDSEKNSTCKVFQSSENILETLACEDFELTLSNKDVAQVQQMVFHNHGDIRFEAKADIYQNKQLASHVHVTVFADGRTTIENTKPTATRAAGETIHRAAGETINRAEVQ